MERIHLELTKAEAKELERIITDTIVLTPPCEKRDFLTSVCARIGKEAER